MKKLFFILLFLIFAGQADANTYWVSKSGTDVNACTNSPTPLTTGAKQTIAAGVACMTAVGGIGHTLMIGPGTYNEANSSINVPSGTDLVRPATDPQPGANTIKAQTAGTVTLAPDNPFNVYNGGFHHVIFDGLKWQTEVAFAGANPAHHIRFINFENTGFTNNAFLGGDGNEYINGNIHDGGTNDQTHGIYMGGHDNIVERVNFNNIKGYCIQIYKSPPGALSNNVLRYNTFSNCNTYTPKAEVTVYYGDNNQIYGNLFKNGPGGGLAVGTASTTNFKIYNNTFYNYPGACLYSDNNSPGSISFVNNICSNTTGIINAGSGSITMTNNLCSSAGTGCAQVESAANTFNSPGTDFTLKTGSLAINNGTAGIPIGTTIPVCTVSITTGCYNGSAPDIGAFETGAPVGVGPPVLTSNPSTVAAGAAMSVTVDDDDVNERTENVLDWVGLYIPGASSYEALDWFYMNQSKTPPTTPISDAVIAFTAPTTLGSYEYRFYANGSALEVDRLATAPFTVIAPGIVLRLSGMTIKIGGETLKIGVP